MFKVCVETEMASHTGVLVAKVKPCLQREQTFGDPRGGQQTDMWEGHDVVEAGS